MLTFPARFRACLGVCALLCFLGAGEPPRLARIDDAMRAYVTADGAPGVITLVADKDRILHLSAIGLADIATGRQIKTDDIIWIASMTKPVTAAALLMLQDEGKVSIDDPVAKYLPECAGLKKPNGQPASITLRNCLTHTSGLTEATQPEREAAVDLAALMHGVYSRPLEFDPGTKYQYRDAGLNTIARVIEVVAKQPYQDFVKARLFDPMGMTDATYYPTEEQMKRVPTSYTYTSGKWEPAPIPVLNGHKATDHNRYAAGNGGLFCTTEDYLRFARMLLNQGSLDGRQYLKPETVKAMTSVQTGDLPINGSHTTGWGLGISVVRAPQGATSMLSPGSFGHGGRFGTEFYIDPVKNRIYIHMIQRNLNGNPKAGNLASLFRDAAGG